MLLLWKCRRWIQKGFKTAEENLNETTNLVKYAVDSVSRR